MFTRFSTLSVIRHFHYSRADKDGRTLPARFRHHDRTRARFRLEGLEQRCLLSGISGYTEYPLPSGISTTEITAGPDGNLWFTDTGANKVGMINPTTHAISEFSVPTANSGLYDITAGPDGNLWFTEWKAGKVGMINPTTHAISEFPLPGGGNGDFRMITAGPDGNLWFGDAANEIGMINPTTHAISVFTLPSGDEAEPWGITAGSDGNVWFMETLVAHVGMINTSTHVVTEFALPSVFVGHSLLWNITSGSDGNLWFTSYGNPYVGVINPTTHAVSDFAIPTYYASGITSGPDGNLWFTQDPGEIGQINPTTDAITEYPVPAGGGITAGPDGNLWFTAGADIGVAALTTWQLVVTQQPPASISAGSPFGLTVYAEDSSGNLLSSFDGTVTVALANNPGGATLGGTLTATASNGAATFSGLILTTAASGYTLEVSGSGLGAGVSSAVTVTAAAASQVAITGQPPASVTAGSGFGLQASIEDQYGNLATSAGNVVSVALANNPTGASLGGTLTAMASQGVATFSGLTLTTAASGYTLGGSSSGLGEATSSALTVTPAAATQLVITQQPPSSVVVNTAFGLQAAIEDAYGNMETSASNTVKVALENNPTGAKLGGTLSEKASSGIASFSGLTISKVGSGYTLQLTSNGLTGAVTNAITVTKSGDAILALSATARITAPDALLAPLVFDSPGILDSLGLKKRARSI